MYKDKIIELCIFHIDNKDKTIEELQAENKRLHDHISHLKREREQLRNDAVHDSKVSYELDDKHIKIIEELEADNKRLSDNL